MDYTDLSATVRRILETHHAFLHRELPRLGVALGAEGKQITAPYAHLQRMMLEHMANEEELLFPKIIGVIERGEHHDLEAIVHQMEHEHEALEVLADAMRNASRDAGAHEAELLHLLDDLAEHHRIEDEVVFPGAIALTRGAAAELPRAALPAHVQTVRHTRGACAKCLDQVPAAVNVREGCVYLDKMCPTHGLTSQLMSRRPEYWAELDRFYFSVNKEEYAQRDYIVRMTERCNLACPICLAKANTEDTADFDLSGLTELLSERRGVKIDLMAAEPTLRPDLFEWVRKIKASGNIAALHTNGLKLADREYVAELKLAGVDEVFLQFDGLDDEANKVLRGRPLLKARLATLANLREAGIATSLIVVVARQLNEAQVSATYRFALRPENSHIREVFYLGLRNLGSARHSGAFDGQMLMPDELIDLLTEQEPKLRRSDIQAFNKIYFAMLSAFKVRKCLYVQHYLVARDGHGDAQPISEVLNIHRLAAAAERYADMFQRHPILARARFAAALVREGLHPSALRMAGDLLKLEQLFAKGMNLGGVPERFLLLGFITACDPENFDADVAINCGKGELSADGGYTESGAEANVQREARFSASARAPGAPSTSAQRARV